MKTKLIAVTIVMAIASCSFAELVSDESIEKAAASWLSSDRVAQMTMKGLSFDKLEHRGSLRVVRLSPSGYIIMSGSDVSDPVVSFSRNDFVDPEEGSPFHAMLEHSDSNVRKHEEAGGARTAKWAGLIGRRGGTLPVHKLLTVEASGKVADSSIVIEPFLKAHWNQGTPWNDFCPLDNETNRCPCGCVATATAQQIAHSKWPWRTGRQDTWVHTLDTDGKQDDPDGPYSDTEVVVRFDGHEPFAWESLLDEYEGYWGDARGRKPERERFAVARFMSWIDVVTKMNFGKGGSGANFGNTGDSATDWYEMWEMHDLKRENPEAVAKMIADFEFGVPVHVGVPGHSVIGHGFAYDKASNSYYLYLNYGWGGSADGWYELYGESSPIGGVFTGFRPRKMVQLETLPKVCDGDVEVKWHLPDCHANTVTGFELTSFTSSHQLMDIVRDFREDFGTASDTNRIYIAKVAGVNNDSEMLVWENCAPGTYQFDGIVTLTSSSILEYRVQSSFAWDGRISVEASFDGGPWQAISIPAMYRNVECNQWTTHRVFLGDHAGKTLNLRLESTHSGGDWVRFDDFILSDVTGFVCEKRKATADARSYKFCGLAPGSVLSVAVKPLFPGDGGIRSEYATTRICGTVRKTSPGAIVGYETNDMVYCEREIGDAWCITSSTEGETTIKGKNGWAGAFSVCLRGNVTTASMLSFEWFLRNCYDPKNGVFDELFVTFADSEGNYTDIMDVTNETLLNERQKVDVSLSKFAGKTGSVIVLFRHYASSCGGDDSIVRFYNPKVTNIAMPVYTIEPEWDIANTTYLPTPEIVSICGSDGLEIDEGVYRELQIGTDALCVKCSQSVTSLKAYPSHLTYLADEDIEIAKSGPNDFLVKMDTSKAPRRQRMMLTLAATDANGTTVYRDVSLRFDTASAVKIIDGWRAMGSLGFKPSNAFTFDNSMLNAANGPLEIGGGNVSYVESPLGFALHHNGDDGPWTKPRLNMPEEWTVLTMARLSDVNNAVLFQFGSSEYDQSGFALASGGKDRVTLSHWRPHSQHVDLLSASVPHASSQYHAYVIRARGKFVELFIDGIYAGCATMPMIPAVGFQLFSVIQGNGDTRLTNASGEYMEDWRMYDAALPVPMIARYANLLAEFDADYPPGWRVDVATFDPNGGELSDAVRTLVNGTAIGDLPNPTREGYVLDGWYTSDVGGDLVTANTVVSGDATFYAHWTELSAMSCIITYSPGANGTGSRQTATKARGVALKLMDATFTRTGYTQTGWTTIDGGEKEYDLGASYTEDVAVTLYPVWTENGGDEPGGDSGGEPGDEPGGGSGGGDEPGGDSGGGDEPGGDSGGYVEPPAPCYETLNASDITAAYDAPKAVTLRGVAYDGCEAVGIVELKLGKVSKGKGKVSGAVTQLNGRRNTIKALKLSGLDGVSPVNVELEVKGMGVMKVAIGGTLFAGSLGDYHVQTAVTGGDVSGDVKFHIDADDLSMFTGDVLTGLLPEGEAVNVSGRKWTFAKAASVKWTKLKGTEELVLATDGSGKGLVVDTKGGAKPNLSSLKLAYTPKKGTFKGSFKLYELQGDGRMTKLRKYTMKVNGIVVDGKGTGFATCRKPMVSGWPVRVE